MSHKFVFRKTDEYAFFNQHVHLLLVDYNRDDRKDLFLIADQEEDGTYVLEYPGELFTEQIKELVTSIFFITVQEENREARYALGAYFTCNRKDYALYYDRDNENVKALVFFRAVAIGNGEYQLEQIEDESEHNDVVEHITDNYGHLLHIE